ncbi:MAG: alpha/beta hydrolase [Ignavibacteria bacterium]|nr:alpha/beta hydrolase [Ignavibacteria bacterium]
MKKIITLLIPLLFSLNETRSQIDTTWTGYIDIMGSKLGIIVTFRTESDSLKAKIDIPDQGAKGLDLTNVSFKNPKVHFELESGLGRAIFEGIYYGDSISGSFTQSGIRAGFVLRRGSTPLEELPYPEDLPYNSEEITFINDGCSFSGTLTYPFGDGKFPAIVLITGSGPQTRDEEVAGFKIFKTLADHLTREGFAVLRYDDRGVNKSVCKTVDESTTEEFAGDVIAAVKYLQTRDNILKNKIGLLGHSEGGIVAPLAAVRYPEIAFIILMAGTGVKGIDILKDQSRLIMAADGSSEKEINSYIQMIDMIYEALRENKSMDEVKKEIKNNIIENFDEIPEEIRKNIKDKNEYASDIANMTVNRFNTTWMKYFLDYDPYETLTRVKCPVLAIFGEKDLQVSVRQNRKFIEEALRNGGNPDYTVEVIPEANHLFQKAVTGSPSEYSDLPKEFVPGFLDLISKWLSERLK